MKEWRAMKDHEELRRLIAGSRRAVVFTGAGLGTESGIPDFRSPGGLWPENMPIRFDDFVRSADMRREAWKRKSAMEESLARATRTGAPGDRPISCGPAG